MGEEAPAECSLRAEVEGLLFSLDVLIALTNDLELSLPFIAKLLQGFNDELQEDKKVLGDDVDCRSALPVDDGIGKEGGKIDLFEGFLENGSERTSFAHDAIGAVDLDETASC
jgi:hypothetical protein